MTMKITRVSLPVRSASLWFDFFNQRLQLAEGRGDMSPSIQLGSTRVEFRQDDGQIGDHHLAFTIPEAKFGQAKRWIGERTTVLSRDGADEFECSPAWNAHSVYFEGPDGAVLELIARRELPPGQTGEFTSASLLAVSEVGVAVSSVPESASALATSAELHPYTESPDETFGAVGTTEGLLILVVEGRTWFPTSDKIAAYGRIDIDATGHNPGRYLVGSSTLTIRD
ncbi:hypothetical protein CVV68_01350 [Arthrobacter livingstonensis]|uniref:VOC domain-containing protein n=1 Tax=Arthrobacter livingstonensis TaxID=670078 RepID=A0A2V5LFC5_9MICC|nr:hypothetical protein [Arthrobacter livingstonensis]PYI69782.1 hypothetical protein CVV68_01350 [Arthrobacter livingstonensis]